MTIPTKQDGSIVTFLRQRDYVLTKTLAQGATGATVLLHDPILDENFVCKKFVPYDESKREELFRNFVREVKLLHCVQHTNIVRVFNYYLYPEKHAGFILMEYVEGVDVQDYIKAKPEQAGSIFQQAIEGFQHLEQNKILHRDIRVSNILVRKDGIVKIIDLGFGKQIQASQDFDKSITLNWHCDPPREFKNKTYDYRTEVYFVGKLFEKILTEHRITRFQHRAVLTQMCSVDPANRLGSFLQIRDLVRKDAVQQVPFSGFEKAVYTSFATQISKNLTKLYTDAKYIDDATKAIASLDAAYQQSMLEEMFPDCAVVLSAIVNGNYQYRPAGFPVNIARDFLQLLNSADEDKRRIIMLNIHGRLNAIPRTPYPADDDIPF